MIKALLLMLFILVASSVKANESFLLRDTITKNDTLVSVHFNNQYSNLIAHSIAQQTGRNCMQIATGPFKKITIHKDRIGIHEAMRLVVQDQPLSFTIAGRVIQLLPVMEDSEAPDLREPLIRLSGTVVERIEGQPIAGVTIQLDRTSRGTFTDANGNFAIDSVPPRGRLRISHVQYRKEVIEYDHPRALVIALTEQVSVLDSYVRKGYYDIRERFNTGSLSSIRAKEISNHVAGDLLKAMGGELSGTLITQSSGVPGSQSKVIIRGQSSIANGNDPLYVVDGVPLLSFLTQGRIASGSLDILLNIPPEDIESIEVLKDADATSIYGSRGANGVILITTKKPKAGKTLVNVNVYQGWGNSIQRLHLMNTQQYLRLRRQALANDNKPPSPTQDHDLNGNWDTTRTTDWQKELIGNTASITQATLTISGGSMHTQFRAGGSYRKETTVYPGQSGNTRYTGNLAVNHQSENGRFTFSGNLNYGDNTLKLPQADLTGRTLLAPNAPELYKDDTLNWQHNTYLNPLADLRQTSETSLRTTRVNSSLSYKVAEHWSVKLFSGFYWVSVNEEVITPFSSLLSSTKDPDGHRINITATNRVKLWILEPQINYSKLLFNCLQTDILLGATLQQTDDERQFWQYSGFTSDAFIRNSGRAETITTNQDEATYRYQAFFMRLGLNYNDKYILNLTARNDGSSRFGANFRNHSFGAIGAAWLFYEEPFIKELLPFLSFGKLSGSIGTTGNDQFPDYRYQYIYTIAPGYSSPGSEVSELVNPFIEWETTTKRELSLKLGFRDNAIILQTNAFYNTGRNQLVPREVSHTTGFEVMLDNIPTRLVNKGLEVELHTRNITRKNFKWTSFFHLTLPYNNLRYYGDEMTADNAKRVAEGYPLNVKFVYDYTGIDTATRLFTFRDVDKNGVVDDKDKIPVAITQRFYGGLRNTFVYKGVSLGIHLQFVAQDGYNDNIGQAEAGRFVQAYSNQPVAIGEGHQRYSGFSEEVNSAGLKYRESTARIDNADYIRLKNISLSIALPRPCMQRMKIQDASIQVKGENIFTLTNYAGRNPETQQYNLTASLPPIRVISFGVQVTL